MDRLLALKASLSEEEKEKIYSDLLGDQEDFESDGDFESICKSDIAVKEIIQYMTSVIKKEFDVGDNTEALLLWDDYKSKYGITLEE